MKKIVIPSRSDLLVPDPGRGDNLPAQGRLVEWNVYWSRREGDGSVTAKDFPETAEKPAKEPKHTKVQKDTEE